MKNNKYLSHSLLLPALIASFFVMSGCDEEIKLGDLALAPV